MTQSNKNITRSLNYAVKSYNRPFFYARQKMTKDNLGHWGKLGGKVKPVEVVVQDGRGLDLLLDEASFQLVDHLTAMQTEDFYKDPKDMLEKVYFEEIKELLKKTTGASHVHIYHHQVRNQTKMNTNNVTKIDTPVQGYANEIHSDASAFTAEEIFKTLARTDEACNENSQGGGRFMYINVWRNISETPIEKDNLAVCDERTLVKPDDYITSELHGNGYDILDHRLNARNSHLHKWYYFPRMTKNEALVFKHWDSDVSKPSRICFHTAFTDPNGPTDSPVRQSIEVRAIIYFPGHKPNSYPDLEDVAPKSLHQLEGEELVRAAAKHLIDDALTNLNVWPANDLKWLKSELSRKDARKGIENIAMELAKDEYDYFGLKALPKKVNKEVTLFLMADKEFENTLRVNFAKLYKQT